MEKERKRMGNMYQDPMQYIIMVADQVKKCSVF